MLESLEAIDRWIVLSINGINAPVLDEIMWFISGKLTWIPLYIFLFYLGFKKLERTEFFIFLLYVLVAVGISDFISSGIFKEFFQRYRPSHNLLIKNELHLYLESQNNYYRGGIYGFVSSHAANFFALATSIGLTLKKYYPKIQLILVLVAVVVSFSRIYLGVHYLSDVIGGAIVGLVVSYFLFWLIQRSKLRISS